MTISFPLLLLIVVLVGLVLAGRGGSSGRVGGTPWWRDDHVPWGGPDEPFHPRDRDLRDRAYEEAEAAYRLGQGGGRAARMDERYGGDFEPWSRGDA
ncbi:MAG: hypothetical protein AB7O78_09945 [Thermoleophilia bacterium]